MDGVIEHYGIKGMKWGIRRYQNADGSLTPAGRKRYNLESKSREASEVQELRRTKTMSEMTNKELQQVVTRMNLEQQYMRLTAQEKAANKSKLDRVLSVAKKTNEVWQTYSTFRGIYNSKEFEALRSAIASRKKG